MTDTYSQCPKCGHKFPLPLPASAACPACGIYFFKWTPSSRVQPLPKNEQDYLADEEKGGFVAALFQPVEKMDAMVFYGRCIVLALLALWSWYLFGYDYRDGEIGASFMHNILLPIHEAGHVLFRPFGEFMTILGGSLFQLVLPFCIALPFLF